MLLTMVSSLGGGNNDQQRQAAMTEAGNEQDWVSGDRCVVRRWNGQYADAVIEELGSNGAKSCWPGL